MKANCLKIISAIVTTLFLVGSTLHGQATDTRIGSIGQRAIDAKPITKEEAEKKYPAPHGSGYPPATRDPHDPSGYVSSPYPPYQKYDCSKIAHGGLVLDIRAKKVFIRP